MIKLSEEQLIAQIEAASARADALEKALVDRDKKFDALKAAYDIERRKNAAPIVGSAALSAPTTPTLAYCHLCTNDQRPHCTEKRECCLYLHDLSEATTPPQPDKRSDV